MYEDGRRAGAERTGLAKFRAHFHGYRKRCDVKARVFFPMTAKKVIRAQKIAMKIAFHFYLSILRSFCRLQEDVFPDTDDLGVFPE